jgi:hypothetical protein
MAEPADARVELLAQDEHWESARIGRLAGDHASNLGHAVHLSSPLSGESQSQNPASRGGDSVAA